MNKMVMIVYNEAVDTEVMEALASCAIKNYTKLKAVFGKGEISGVHLGTDIWPGRNNIVYIVCDETSAGQVLSRVRGLRKNIGSEGVKAFMLPVEEVT